MNLKMAQFFSVPAWHVERYTWVSETLGGSPIAACVDGPFCSCAFGFEEWSHSHGPWLNLAVSLFVLGFLWSVTREALFTESG